MAAASRTEDCLPWPYGTNGSGYGVVRWEGRKRPAHRVVLELVEGPPPAESMEAAHAPLVCHNRLCVSPAHLRWATSAENKADRVLDGTVARGTGNGSAKLTEAQALAVYNDPRPQSEIAAEYGIPNQQVSRIKRGVTWAWLTEANQ